MCTTTPTGYQFCFHRPLYYCTRQQAFVRFRGDLTPYCAKATKIVVLKMTRTDSVRAPLTAAPPPRSKEPGGGGGAEGRGYRV